MRMAILGIMVLATATLAQDNKDGKSLQGTYQAITLTKRGEAAPAEVLKELQKITIKGDVLSLHFGSETKTAKLKIDASKTPMHVDLIPNDGPSKGKLILGLGMLEKDTLRLAFADENDSKRPTEFKSTKENKVMLLVLRRVMEQ